MIGVVVILFISTVSELTFRPVKYLRLRGTLVLLLQQIDMISKCMTIISIYHSDNNYFSSPILVMTDNRR